MLEQIIEFLQVRPGYLKEGGGRLASILAKKDIDVTPEECREAIRIFNKGIEVLEEKARNIMAPKILLLDIETTPLEAYVFQMSVWKANINTDAVISEWFMLTWSAKWLLSPEVMSMRLTPDEVAHEDDSRIATVLWDLLNEADIVIAHNGDRFDIPNMNTRFILAGLGPTTPFQTIDTLLVARKQFGFTHNSLNALAKQFGFPVKIETNFALWKRCKNGDRDALMEMEVYNRHDVEILEEVYLKLRPWIKSHPNVGLYMEASTEVCPNCGSDHIATIGHYYTQVGKYEALRCECGAIARRRVSVIPLEKRKSLTVSISK